MLYTASKAVETTFQNSLLNDIYYRSNTNILYLLKHNYLWRGL